MTSEEKYDLPKDVQAECLAIVRGYRRRLWSDRPEDQRRVEAVKKARESIGADLPENMRKQLQGAIIKNCLDGRKAQFHLLGISFVSRSEFYRRRRYFLREVAEQLGIA